MKNLQEATERICELKGSVVALDAFCSALLHQLIQVSPGETSRVFATAVEAARTSMLNASISDHSIAAFEADAERIGALLSALERKARDLRGQEAVEPLLLAVPRVTTFAGQRRLSGASGFFFEREGRLFLVSSRHVFIDAPTQHHPDRIEVELHAEGEDLAAPRVLSLLLYEDGHAAWRQAADGGGDVDVAVLEIGDGVLGDAMPHAFTPEHLQDMLADVPVGAPLLVVGFPLGFHDGLNHLPVARSAAVASSFGLRFQGQGLFLTDGRTHRGSSGAPVVMRRAHGGALPWTLLGVHSSRLDMGGRDPVEDESLGLNCAWYADVLMTLTRQA